MDTPPEIPWTRLAAFVRQHTHDVRNHLNGMDLEAALLSELVNDDAEAKATVARLRQQIRETSTELRAMSVKFAPAPVAKSEVTLKDLFLIWKDQVSTLKSPPQVEWREPADDARVSVDLDALARTFRELFVNAREFGTGEPLRAEAEIQNGCVTFRLIEPKTEAVDCTAWGLRPLVSTRRGGYGLGLWGVQHDIADSGGTISRRYDPAAKTLTTALAFPTV